MTPAEAEDVIETMGVEYDSHQHNELEKTDLCAAPVRKRR
jgi:hypothetical protein